MLKHLITLSLFSVLSINSAQATAIYSANYSHSLQSTQSADGLDLRWGKTEADYLQIFDEAQNIRINSNQLRVDYLLGENIFAGDDFRGGNRHPSNKPSLTEGNYNVHLLHFDPLGTSKGDLSKVRISFDENIVAIILSGKYLRASDQLLGGVNTKYLRNAASGLERHDFLSFESPRTLLVDRLWVGRYWIDDARIITQAVPEPGSMALFGLGLIGLIGARSFASRKENDEH